MTDWTRIRQICKVDTSLNYGRHLIRKFLRDAAPSTASWTSGPARGTTCSIAERFAHPPIWRG